MTPKRPHIAVLYATEEGSTRDIAEYVAADLEERSAEVELHDIDHAPDPSRFDTVILGSAIHDMDFLPAAADYLRHHRDQLATTDLRLFGVGLGPALRGPLGRRLGRLVPPKISALCKEVAARDYRAFAGHYERAGVSFKARALYRLMGGGRYGDLRDWPAIIAWSTALGDSLGLPRARVTVIHP
ncbi:flavodoxin domain-containing protein [Nocardia rhamnosiphila]|uniref:Flavodoxin domain-containing protein n=1 Tax=Nocardia rhamnosiphila TaxID=426716 RepID=A0ABV2WMG6_9NOCA|nr:flavodoxin domain-containing protein [Nocardia rhamnosiphila]